MVSGSPLTSSDHFPTQPLEAVPGLAFSDLPPDTAFWLRPC